VSVDKFNSHQGLGPFERLMASFTLLCASEIKRMRPEAIFKLALNSTHLAPCWGKIVTRPCENILSCSARVMIGVTIVRSSRTKTFPNANTQPNDHRRYQNRPSLLCPAPSIFKVPPPPIGQKERRCYSVGTLLWLFILYVIPAIPVVGCILIPVVNLLFQRPHLAGRALARRT
jgi:hypothetical protein